MNDSKVTTQASDTLCSATRGPRTSITSSDLLEAIKELETELKGDNDKLRKDINSLHQETSSKLHTIAEEMQGLKE